MLLQRVAWRGVDFHGRAGRKGHSHLVLLTICEMIHSQLYLIWPTCNIFGRMLPLFLWNTFLSSKAACSQSFSHNTLDSFQYSFLVSLHISLNSKHWSVLGISLQSSLYLHSFLSWAHFQFHGFKYRRSHLYKYQTFKMHLKLISAQ